MKRCKPSVGCVDESAIAACDRPVASFDQRRCGSGGRQFGNRRAGNRWALRCALAASGVLAWTLLCPADRSNAQTQQEARSPAAAPSAVEACNQFKDALKPTPQPNAPSAPERAQQGLGRVANAGQQGITCAQALAKYFESLRKGGAKGAWSEIEREMDIVIDTYRNLLEAIEGTGGAYEEGKRAVSVLEEQIKDMVQRRGEKHPNVVSAQTTRDSIATSLEQTKKLKAKLDGALVDLQGRKSEIVEAEGIRRYSAAEDALNNLNEGLKQVIEELLRAVNKPGS
jgi:hypothetical protein